MESRLPALRGVGLGGGGIEQKRKRTHGHGHPRGGYSGEEVSGGGRGH